MNVFLMCISPMIALVVLVVSAILTDPFDFCRILDREFKRDPKLTLEVCEQRTFKVKSETYEGSFSFFYGSRIVLVFAALRSIRVVKHV